MLELKDKVVDWYKDKGITRGFPVEEYEVNLVLKVDPDSNFFESDKDANVQIMLELLQDLIYDVDDVKLSYIEVERRD